MCVIEFRGGVGGGRWRFEEKRVDENLAGIHTNQFLSFCVSFSSSFYLFLLLHEG